MKRNNLTTAVIAGIAGVAGMANAVNLNPDGLGQVLIYPYYTVNANNNTLISVVNTHNEGKAVKVRFLEGYNSREVLDFNLYLSPFDVWTAALFSLSADATGGGALVTTDTSCTVPAIRTNSELPTDSQGRHYAAFFNYAYTSGGYGNPSGVDSGPTNLARTREGHFEMIEMGVVTDATSNKSLTALTHVGGTSPAVPKNCNQLVNAWATGGYWAANPSVDMAPPTGGLFGAASIINVGDGIFNGYTADAVDGFSYVINHTNPGSLFPSLAQAQTAPGVATSYVFNNGQLIVADYPTLLPAQGIDAVSAVFMADAVYNEYYVDKGVLADSEWIVTFPTKRYYVDPGVVGTTPASYIPPFEEVFGGGLSGGKPADPGVSCFVVGLGYYDREEQHPTGKVIFSPPPPTGVDTLCYEAQVLTFAQSGASSAVLGSTLISNVSTNYTAGWLRLDLNDASHTLRSSLSGDVFHGLPVTGFLAENVVNKNAQPGKLASYGGLFRHRVSRICSTVITAGNPTPGAVCS